MAGYMSSTNQVFGGDEVGAVVVSIGSSTTKSGFGGEDCPRSIFASYTGLVPGSEPVPIDTGPAAPADTKASGAVLPVKPRPKLYVGEQLGLRTAGMQIRPVLEDGLVGDWESVEAIWQHALVGTLRIDPKEHPLLVSEPTHNTAADREKTVQLLFDKFDLPAVYLAKDSVLTSFAFGRPTSVVIKSGSSYTTAVPVFEGHAMLRGVMRSSLAGDLLSDKLLETIAAQGTALRPRQTLERAEVPAGSGSYQFSDVAGLDSSFSKFWARQATCDIKAQYCRTSLFPHLIASSEDTAAFELPDGKEVHLKADSVWGLAELMFSYPGESTAPIGVVQPLAPALRPPAVLVADLVEQAINKCDVDLKRELYANVVVSGGNTLWPGFTQRVGKALGEKISQGIKLKLHSATTAVEQHYSTWIGGSILSSLGTFHQLWISKEEYGEMGAAACVGRCP